MIFHVSISADDPSRVANVLAELWNGEVQPFPPIGEGSLAVLAGDTRNSIIEVYPRGTELVAVDGDADAIGVHNPHASRRTATHAAIATPLAAEDVLAIAAREGWTAKYRKRGGLFGVVEFWLENTTMLELLTADMQSEYLETMTNDGWRAVLASGLPE